MRSKLNPILRDCFQLAALTAVCLWPLAAQTQEPKGAYGFLINEYRLDSGGKSGGVALGVLRIEEGGSVNMKFTFQGRDPMDPASAQETGELRGTYTSISEGVGILEVTDAEGFQLTFAVVTTDNGQTLELISPVIGSGTPVLRGSDRSLNGLLFTSLLFDGAAATDAIPIAVQRPNSGGKVFTGGGSARGKMTCPDGSTGDWTVSIDNLTIAVEAVANGPTVGNYLLSASLETCGDHRWTTLSGLVTGSFGPPNSVLRLPNNGSRWSGTAKAIRGRVLNGLYSLHSSFWPFPGGRTAVLHFDGEGQVRGTFIGSVERTFNTFDLNGRYSIQDDGAGTIDLNTTDGQPGGPSFSIVVVEDGAGFLYIRKGVNPAGSVEFGHARAQ